MFWPADFFVGLSSHGFLRVIVRLKNSKDLTNSELQPLN